MFGGYACLLIYFALALFACFVWCLSVFAPYTCEFVGFVLEFVGLMFSFGFDSILVRL